MNAQIEDAMGLETGIRIDMVRTNADRNRDRIDIHGRMTSCMRSAMPGSLEPDVECAIIDKNGCIAATAVSSHNGNFWTNRQAYFTIEMMDLKNSLNWDELDEIRLRLIFCGK